MSGQIQKVTRSECCCICGGPDWCFRIYHDDGSTTHHCYRDNGLTQTDVTGTDGRLYKFKLQKSGDVGTYGIFQEMSEYEVFQETWRKEHGRQGNGNKKVIRYTPVTKQQVIKEELQPVASPARLDTVYRTFLSLLVLENKHREILKEEWQKGIESGLWQHILSVYPIKSLPPEDKVRFKLINERFLNKTRKNIMEQMIQKFGDLTGVPGFYQRADGRWTFASIAGIIYPQFNSKGQITRLRIADDFPKVAAGNDSEYVFSLKDASWYKLTADKQFILVDSQEKNVHNVPLTKRGYPQGKVDGKYKYFSSHYTMRIQDESGVVREVNRFRNGTRSGVCCSIYTKPGDSYSTVYVTEGEKKAMVTNMLLGAPVISLPGVGTFSQLGDCEAGYDTSLLDFLSKKGCKNLVVAYDSDKKTNIQVLTSEKKLTKFLLDKGFKVYIAEWSEKFGKGLDDISIMGVRPTYYPITI